MLKPLIYRRSVAERKEALPDKERDSCRRKVPSSANISIFDDYERGFLTVAAPSVVHLHNLKWHLESMRRAYTNNIYRSPRDNGTAPVAERGWA